EQRPRLPRTRIGTSRLRGPPFSRGGRGRLQPTFADMEARTYDVPRNVEADPERKTAVTRTRPLRRTRAAPKEHPGRRGSSYPSLLACHAPAACPRPPFLESSRASPEMNHRWNGRRTWRPGEKRAAIRRRRRAQIRDDFH